MNNSRHPTQGEDLCFDFVYLRDGNKFIVGRRLIGSKDEYEKVGVLNYKSLKVYTEKYEAVTPRVTAKRVK